MNQQSKIRKQDMGGDESLRSPAKAIPNQTDEPRLILHSPAGFLSVSDITCPQEIINPKKRGAPKGEKNINWKGGIAEYPNHSLMKRIRKFKLQSTNYICECCGGKATEIHHLDKSKTNHSFNNFKSLCHKCHMGIFHKDSGQRGNHNSGRKPYFYFGFSVQQISVISGYHPIYLTRLFKKGLQSKCIHKNHIRFKMKSSYLNHMIEDGLWPLKLEIK
jgi:hypothetical protein